MREDPAGSGTYTGQVPPLHPHHGLARVFIQVVCPNGSVVLIVFNIYIDPSGLVKDTNGNPISGATVVLFRSDTSTGPFTQVPSGSSIMSPANRNNPDLTDPAGHFGWDVTPGFYKVRASKANCHAPGNPSQSFVETPVLEIPPPVTNLELVLECPRPANAVCAAPPPPPPGAILAKPGVTTFGTSGNDVIYGTGGPDRIAGLGGNDPIFGAAGDDQLTGGHGDDILCGGDGNDQLAGDAGNDTLSGDGGNDDLAGNVGNDRLFGGTGVDRLSGGDGSDTCTPGGEPGDAAVPAPNCDAIT
jgi:hypothetical protein